MSATDDVLKCFSTDGHPGLPATVDRLPTVGEVRRAVAEVERLRWALEIIKSLVDPNTAAYEVADDALKGGKA